MPVKKRPDTKKKNIDPLKDQKKGPLKKQLLKNGFH